MSRLNLIEPYFAMQRVSCLLCTECGLTLCCWNRWLAVILVNLICFDKSLVLILMYLACIWTLHLTCEPYLYNMALYAIFETGPKATVSKCIYYFSS